MYHKPFGGRSPPGPTNELTALPRPASSCVIAGCAPEKERKERERFYAPQLVPAGTAEARISYGNSVRLSVRLSRPGGIPSPGEIETPGLTVW